MCCMLEDVLKRKLSPFTKEDNPHGVVADTSFATIFPKYREEYIRECFPLLEQKLNEYVSNNSEDFKSDPEVYGGIACHETRIVYGSNVTLKSFLGDKNFTRCF